MANYFDQAADVIDPGPCNQARSRLNEEHPRFDARCRTRCRRSSCRIRCTEITCPSLRSSFKQRPHECNSPRISATTFASLVLAGSISARMDLTADSTLSSHDNNGFGSLRTDIYLLLNNIQLLQSYPNTPKLKVGIARCRIYAPSPANDTLCALGRIVGSRPSIMMKPMGRLAVGMSVQAEMEDGDGEFEPATIKAVGASGEMSLIFDGGFGRGRGQW